MRQEYDADADALYIHLRDLRDGEHVARTAGMDVSTMVDEDAGGRILGIEVLSPGRLWPLAEILRRYEVSAADAAMLMACYPCAFSVSAQPPRHI
jgi:uncharacterized protein YuzE